MVFRELWEQYPSAIKELSNLERFRTEVCWTRSVEIEERSRLYFVLVQPSKPRALANNAYLSGMDLWPANKFHHKFKPLKSTEYENTDKWNTRQIEGTA